ncbi:MAG TPA: hypothetical protein EYP29_04000 [Thermoplasmata archaeon]|nr:hypothetical protein [Thermoplasmata archaeon]
MPENKESEKEIPLPQQEEDEYDYTLEELFIELKNTSELMVDLAYTALIYHDKGMAVEISELEEMIDSLNKRIQRKAIYEYGREDENINTTLAIIRLASALENVADAARDIADVVLRDVEPHPIIKMSIEESDTVTKKMVVPKGSIFAGKELRELRILNKYGVRINAIKRGRMWIHGPEGETLLKEGDVLFCAGTEDGMKELEKAFARKREVR